MGKTCRAPIMLGASGKRKAPTGSRFSTRTSNRLQPADRFSLAVWLPALHSRIPPVRADVRTMCSVDFAGSGLYSQFNNAGEPQWLRVQSRDGGTARPLEPDAGNAAEGSEGPIPDWRFQRMRSFRPMNSVVKKTI